MDNEPILLQIANEVQEYSKALTELRLMLHAAVASMPDGRIELSKEVIDKVQAGEYTFSVMNKPNAIVLTADKKQLIEVVK